MLRFSTDKYKVLKGARFQFELLEPRHLFSVSPLDLPSSDTPPLELTSTAPQPEQQADQALTNFTFLPLVFLGSDNAASVSNSIVLTGEVVVYGNINLSLQWSKVSGPGNAVFGNSSSEISSVTFDQAGTYELQLAATNAGLTSFDRILVTVTGSAPLAAYDRWIQDMIKFGRRHGEWLLTHQNDTAIDPPLAATFYDAARVFYQIADFTGDATWDAYAQAAVKIYRDRYVLPNNGGVSGYWNFTRGLVMHYERTGDAASRDAVILLSNNAAYASDVAPLPWTESSAKSREVAYAMMSYLDAERVGAPRRARLEALAEQALGHLDQWFIQKSDPDYCPFMFALTADALMQYYEQVDQDPRIIENLAMGADWSWDNAWIADKKAFYYSTAGNLTTGAPDLNLLIAPVYEWLYQKTGDAKYRSQGDQVFAGGVAGAWLDGAKQFNQNYRVSFDFVAMRLSQAARQASMSQPSATMLDVLDIGFALTHNNSAITDPDTELLRQDPLTFLPSSEPSSLPELDSKKKRSLTHDKPLPGATGRSKTNLEWSDWVDRSLSHHFAMRPLLPPQL